jgi:NAD(P)-dependent dehydrogenase (short-subunit alcohol dehydrogenase family)
MTTVLITGCSSGFGLETARHFLARDWQVIATMRTPRDDLLPPSSRLRVLQLDVTDQQSIHKAGFGAPAPFELTRMETVRSLFETNTFGTVAVTQAVLPQMRERKSGVVVNVTSSVTYKALPLVGIYRASKAAVNAFTESLASEMEAFGVRVRIVLPGSSGETRFRETASAGLRGMDSEIYGEFMRQAIARMRDSTGAGTHSTDVAQAVWRAATDPSSPMYIPAGADAVAWAAEAHGVASGGVTKLRK